MTCGNLPPTPYTIMDFRIRVGRRIQGRDLIAPAADIGGDNPSCQLIGIDLPGVMNFSSYM